MIRRSWMLAAVMIASLGAAYAQEKSSTPAKQGAETKSETDAKPADREEDAQYESLMAARHAIEAGKRVDAIVTIDKVIAYYEAKYPEGKQRWFVARDAEESLAYMLMAAADMDKGTDKRSASALVNWWAEAYYMKGYALVELGKIGNAKAEYEHALRLSPYNSQYLSELGNAYQGEKNWPKALDLYTKADDAAAFSRQDQKVVDATRAKRGQGYVLVELNRLDEAESKYKESLSMDPHDSKSQNELEYIRQIRSQRK